MNPMKTLTSFVCTSCRRAFPSRNISKSIPARSFSTTPRTLADEQQDAILSALSPATRNSSTRNTSSRDSYGFSDLLGDSGPPPGNDGISILNTLPPRHRLHVFATKHNTHLTLTAPVPPKNDSSKDAFAAPEPNKVILSLAAGNIGFRKAGRGTYDAAYQLTAFVMKQIQERGLLRSIREMDIVLRGFGAGREAVTKALMGAEGRFVRGKIMSISDATRLKFGGPRSPKPRRLG